MPRDAFLVAAGCIAVLHALITLVQLTIFLLIFTGFYRSHTKLAVFAGIYTLVLVVVDIVYWPYCPLTLLENSLLWRYDPNSVYHGSFVLHVVKVLTGIQLPEIVMIIVSYTIYVSFGVYILNRFRKK